MMLIEASWPSKSADAVTRRTGCWGLVEVGHLSIVGHPSNYLASHLGLHATVGLGVHVVARVPSGAR